MANHDKKIAWGGWLNPSDLVKTSQVGFFGEPTKPTSHQKSPPKKPTKIGLGGLFWRAQSPIVEAKKKPTKRKKVKNNKNNYFSFSKVGLVGFFFACTIGD